MSLSNHDINLLKDANIVYENREHSIEEIKYYRSTLMDFIMNHSTKTGEIPILLDKYSGIIATFDARLA